MTMLKKIYSNLWVVRYIIHILYFNFHYLPFRQAIKLPIFLYKPRFLCCEGKISISGRVRTGMIKLGRNFVSLYPDGGISWENRGIVEFHGECYIGRNSCLSTGKNGHIVFGKNFVATNTFKIASYDQIIFGENVLCGWECMFIDTDFHQLQCDNAQVLKAYGSIIIGNHCWFGFRNTVMKNTVVPSNCVIASNSLLNRKYDVPEKSLLAGMPAKLVRKGVYLDVKNDIIKY